VAGLRRWVWIVVILAGCASAAASEASPPLLWLTCASDAVVVTYNGKEEPGEPTSIVLGVDLDGGRVLAEDGVVIDAAASISESTIEFNAGPATNPAPVRIDRSTGAWRGEASFADRLMTTVRMSGTCIKLDDPPKKISG
jgi:hypothetical protein